MAGSLRDQLSEAFTEAEQETAGQATQEVTTGEATTSEPAGNEAAASTPAQADQNKPGRTAGRERDEKGRLLPGPAKRPETNSAAEGKPSATSPITAQAQTPPAAETKPRPQRPSSWKKEMWDHWEKLDPSLAEYLHQRESEFAKGVSTYKQEAERAKELWDAIAPFQPALQQHGINPVQHIQTLFNAHQRLALGSPQDKLAMFAQLARDYQVPIEHLFVRGQDGQVYMNPQLQQQAQQPRQQQQPDVRKTVQEILAEERARSEVERMKSDTERYPHFEAVRNEMIGLLQSGLATDYASAYDAALRLPQHFHLFEAMQQQQREAEEAKKREAAAAAAATARRNAISPKTSTPTAAASGAKGTKGLRAALEEAVEVHSTGRV